MTTVFGINYPGLNSSILVADRQSTRVDERTRIIYSKYGCHGIAENILFISISIVL
jgi:hypothetical protein